ncbi:MAG: SPASM domain-containing protein [Bacteroidales bacterium]|jgi:radical SAM protein with 4Fe4S-binding SPASM domain|nr:SPASM domain-containing protein [Bacteroidales bacterium]
MKELTRSRGNMSRDMFNSIIDQLSPFLSYLTLYFQGEPYLNPNFFEFIRYARSKNIYVSSSTNGHFLDKENIHQTIESGLNRLIISLDGADQESYSAYRFGGSLDKVTDGIRLLANEKRRFKSKTPKVILQCLLLRSNEHQLEDIKELGRKLGVDKVTFKTAQFNDFWNGNPLMPENPGYSRYYRIDEKSKVKSQKSKKTQNSKFKNQNYNSKLKSEDPSTFQIPKSPNFPIFKSSNLQIFKSSNFQIFKSLNFQIFKSSNLQIPKSSNFQIFKSLNFQIFKSSNLQIPKSSNFQIFKSSNLQIPDSPSYYILKNRQPNSCFRMWSGCVFTWDGKVVPCCFDKDALHVLGDLNQNSFAEIWKSEPYNAFRATILKNRKSMDICNNCTQTF